MSKRNFKEKVLFYFIATVGGNMPSKAYKDLERLTSHMATCKKGWPDYEWKIYAVVRPAYEQGEPKPEAIVQGADERFSKALISEYTARHGSKLLEVAA